MTRAILVLALLMSGACKLSEKNAADSGPGKPAKDKLAPPAGGSKASEKRPAAEDSGSQEEIKIFYAGQTLSVRHQGSRWELRDGGQTYALESTGGYAFKFYEGGSLTAEAGFKEDKLKFKSGDGTLWLKLKFKREEGKEKIKVSLVEEEAEPWALKIKEDKVKVEKGETEVGKVKYYPDTGKLKLKDAQDNEVASTKDLNRLSAALGVFLIDLDPGRRYCLLLTLLALGK
jgi:hypothetical protein